MVQKLLRKATSNNENKINLKEKGESRNRTSIYRFIYQKTLRYKYVYKLTNVGVSLYLKYCKH